MSPSRSVGRNRFARLREFADFWAHEAGGHPCCLFVTDEELEADSEPFDCQACPVAEALDRLQEDRANWEAWVLFRRIVTRFGMDTHTIGTMVERMTRDLEVEPYGELMDRFTLLYDALYPPPESKTE